MPTLFSDRPFPTLVLHFARAMFRGSEDTGSEVSIAGILGLLAVPGAVLSLALLDKYSSLLAWIRGQRHADALVTSIPDKYFFIVFSMVVTGVIAVVQWDRILPGRLDFLNLAPLPISLRAVFAANLAAILLVAAIFAIVINAASAILFPAIVTASQQMFSAFFSFAAIHAVCVAAASAFTFFACLAVMGLMMALLPHGLFRRVSLYVRVAMVVALAAMLAGSFSVPPLLKTSPDGFARYLPPVWYLALYQTLQHRAIPGLESAAAIAMPALGAAFLLALAAYALSYRRYFLRLPEMTDRAPSRPAREWPLPARVLPSAFQQSCYWFGMKTLLRRESHSIVLGAFTGLGLIAAAQTLMAADDPVSRLEAPLMVAYMLICGARLSFELPAAPAANWIFRFAIDRERHQSMAVARKMILTFLVPAVILPVAILGAAVQAGYVALLSWLLIEIVLTGYRRIPFTSPLPPFDSSVTTRLAIYLVGFFLFAWAGARIEYWALAQPARFAFVAAGAVAVWLAIRFFRNEAGDRALDFGQPAASGLQLNS